MSEDLRFPVGRFETPVAIDASTRAALIREIGDAPERLRRAVEGLARTSSTLRIAREGGPCGRSCITCPTVT